MNEKLFNKQKILNELVELDKFKTRYTELISFNGNFDITRLAGEIEWNIDGKLLERYKTLKHKALLVKLKAVNERTKHLNKELKKG